MKKCKITLSDNIKSKSLCLFPDAETLYSIVNAGSKRTLNGLLKSHPESEIITLKRGQWLEAEWNGCQNFFRGNYCTKISFVRIAKATSTKKKNEGSLISVHFGWILNDHLKFSDGINNDLKTKNLNDYDEQFNFSDLFQDNETIEDILKSASKFVII